MSGMEFIDPDDSSARRVFLNDAGDPSDFAAFSYLGDSYSFDPVLGGGVETGYASGRSRLYSTADDTTSVSLTLPLVDASQIAWLKAHRGREVCFRDHLGRKMYGAYQHAPVTVSTDNRAWAADSASVELTSVTHSESV